MLVVLSRTTHSKTNLLGAPAVFECMHACAGAGVSYYYNSSSVLLHKTYVDFQRQAGETSAIEIQKHASKSSLSLSVYIALIDIYIYVERERERGTSFASASIHCRQRSSKAGSQCRFDSSILPWPRTLTRETM